jgi:oligopeptide transport system substrate-binding protein
MLLRRLSVFLTCFFVATICNAPAYAEEQVFRFHLSVEPHSLDPARLTSTDASYFFNNIVRGLYSYSNEKGLLAEGAESCLFETQLKLICRLKKTKWSDGSEIVAGDYVRAFRRLASPGAKTGAVELIKNLRNTLDAFAGKVPTDKIGIRAEGNNELIFEFQQFDPDFLYKLTSNYLVPVKLDRFPIAGDLKGLYFNGPYRVVRWQKGRRLRLEANPYYVGGNPQRPPVEILFLDDDQTALNLYERQELTFLRRLPTTYISKYRSRPDFLQLPVARFDYLGFGEALRDQPDLRAALSYAADYHEMQKMLDALGIPGCPSLPEELVDHPHCVKFDIEKARKHWIKVPLEIRKKRFQLKFSKLGGDDVKKSMEWFQAQWKKNLGFEVDLEQTEQQVYLAELHKSAPAIFRKGITLDRPTCLAALETFARGGSENFLKFEDPEYQTIIEKLGAALKPAKDGLIKKTTQEAKSLCGEGIERLLSQNWLIPMGRIHWTLLVSKKFQDWSLNEMNQLDLSELSVVKP